MSRLNRRFSRPQPSRVDGKFDNSRYNGILNQMGMTADQYAQALRNQLTTQQLINGVAGTDFYAER